MLDDYKTDQPIIYRIIKNSVDNDRLSHAYIIETNGYNKSFDFVLSMVKCIICPNKKSNNDGCKECSICKKIDNNEFIELKVIEADGQWIKKSQLEDLQLEFSKKSIEGNRKIYVIKAASKLNVSSSNSLLKFLEEPEPGIIAILMVENISQLLSTIVSRCQILSLRSRKKYDNLENDQKITEILHENLKIENIETEEEISLKIKQVVEFISYFETNGMMTLVYVNKLWNNYFKERKDLIDAFSLIVLLYKDILNKKLNRKIEFFNDYKNEIEKISNKNTIEVLTNKISFVTEITNKIKFNINNNSLMDKLIIGLKGCEDK